jgi:DNA-binding phage protein
VVLEQIRQGNWLLLVRTPTGQLGLRVGDSPDELFVFGEPNQNMGAAVQVLHRRMSPLIFRRLRNDRTFGSVVLLEAVRALLDNDVDLTKGLLRRFVDTTCGFAQLAELAEGHPKSLIRMLGPNGNPSAKRLMAILTLLTRVHRVRFAVGIKSNA